MIFIMNNNMNSESNLSNNENHINLINNNEQNEEIENFGERKASIDSGSELVYIRQDIIDIVKKLKEFDTRYNMYFDNKDKKDFRIIIDYLKAKI